MVPNPLLLPLLPPSKPFHPHKLFFYSHFWDLSPKLPFLKTSLHLPFGIPFRNSMALIIRSFPFGQGKLYFDPAIFEIDAQRHKRIALFMQVTDQPFDLAAVHEQLASA
jgi:hypothetical protein